MKIFFFPYYPNNPYQPNLARELSVMGCQVEGAKDVSLPTLWKAIADKDIYHLHWTDPYVLSDRLWKSLIKSSAFFLFLFAVKLRRCKLVWTIHNFGKHEKSQQPLELFTHRLIARLCNGIITHSHFAKKKITEKYWLNNRTSKIHVIPHGSYIGNYPDTMTRVEAMKAQGLAAEKKVFLFLGQLRRYKGIPELVNAFSKITSGEEVLIIAGRPYDRESQDALAKLVEPWEHIRFYPGFIPDEKIQEFMKAADAVVFPFRDILTSGSVILAMSFGKAIIVPEIESLTEIIDAGGAITYSPSEGDGLEKALRSALHADLAELGRNNLAAAKELSWQSIARSTARMYSE